MRFNRLLKNYLRYRYGVRNSSKCSFITYKLRFLPGAIASSVFLPCINCLLKRVEFFDKKQSGKRVIATQKKLKSDVL
jgi:hypothetical protein